MVCTNGRAPGNQVVRGPWPARVQPLSDETLSSWLVRSSLANFSTPSEIVNYLWPRWRAWTRDIDRQLSQPQKIELSRVSTLSVSHIDALTLAPIVKQLTGRTTLSDFTPWKWVIQRSTRNQNTNRSTQFCPLCFQADPVPYLRLQWRLSFITVCVKHQVELLDCCPHCGASVEVHKLRRGKISSCAHCRWDMGDTHGVLSDPELVKATIKLINSLRADTKQCAPNFELLSYYICLARRLPEFASTISDPLLKQVISCVGKTRHLEISSLSFDWLNTDDRRHLVTSVVPLLSAGTRDVGNALLKSGLSVGLLMNITPDFPQELLQHFPPRNESKPRQSRKTRQSILKPKSKRLVQRRWQNFLKRHGLIL